MTQPASIYLRSLGTSLPERWVGLDALRLRSKPEVLAGFGFTGAAIADDLDPLVLEAARQALGDLAPTEVGALLYASALASGHTRASATPSGDVLDAFCYRASWLQDALSLDRAVVSGIAQQGCAGMFSALRQARALLLAEPELENVLCVGADAFGAEGTREILYNVVSDAACAVMLSRNVGWARWLGHAQISQGYYWDVPAREVELIAAYFPTARAVIRKALAQAQLEPGEIDLIIPTGVNAASWPILLRLCGLAEDRLYQPQARFGHTIAADSLIYLSEARTRGVLRGGQRVLLFTYGFGSSWCALILEVVA